MQFSFSSSVRFLESLNAVKSQCFVQLYKIFGKKLVAIVITINSLTVQLN